MKKVFATLFALSALLMLSGCVLRTSGSFSASIPQPPTVHAGVTVGVNAPHPPTAAVVVPGPPVIPSATVVANVSIPRPTIVAGATIVGTSCSPNAPELLNGIDDNCNGQIDEGFVGTGTLQITLGWDSPADMDLYVTDPTGTEISYMNERSPSGGYLDRDARGACLAPNAIGENVYWEGNPPAGHYAVKVNYYSNCDSAGATTFWVSVAYGGQIVGQYQFTANAGETVGVLDFDL